MFNALNYRRILSVIFLGLSILLITRCNFITGSFADAITGATNPLTQDGNSLYHKTNYVNLESGILEVGGEVKDPGIIDLKKHYKREIIMKESLYEKDSVQFIGAYRYIGYSLFDLLNEFNQQKKNAEDFRPAIDLYITIENDIGESLSFSWSEIFHTNIPHHILIATEMAPILPYRKEVEYPMGSNWKVVAGNDLLTYRSLENPTRITVASFDKKDYPINRDLSPLYSPQIDVYDEDKLLASLHESDISKMLFTYETTFFGMGMGYHPSDSFRGQLLNNLLASTIDMHHPTWLKQGLVCFVGLDGYRSIFSFSELFNRTDQVFPLLAIIPEPHEGGYFRMFHPGDFFADRSVKSLAEMYFFIE